MVFSHVVACTSTRGAQVGSFCHRRLNAHFGNEEAPCTQCSLRVLQHIKLRGVAPHLNKNEMLWRPRTWTTLCRLYTQNPSKQLRQERLPMQATLQDLRRANRPTLINPRQYITLKSQHQQNLGNEVDESYLFSNPLHNRVFFIFCVSVRVRGCSELIPTYMYIY